MMGQPISRGLLVIGAGVCIAATPGNKYADPAPPGYQMRHRMDGSR